MRKILKFDDPGLTLVCEPVEDEREVTAICRDLAAVIKHRWSECIGLAAPQIGIARRVVAFKPGGSTWTPAIRYLINPEVIWSSTDEIVTAREGCMSYPLFFCDVRRPRALTVRYRSPGAPDLYTENFDGIDARIIQHEIDHLDGRCLVGDAWRASQKGAKYVQSAKEA